MSFNPPTFNLLANVWRVNGTVGAYGAPDLTVMCNLSQGRRTMLGLIPAAGHPAPWIFNELLVPKLTDIRALWNGVVEDLIECPAGSKRFYGVEQVDDVGKGFPNEYRLVIMLYQKDGNNTLGGGPFAAPVPLP